MTFSFNMQKLKKCNYVRYTMYDYDTEYRLNLNKKRLVID